MNHLSHSLYFGAAAQIKSISGRRARYCLLKSTTPNLSFPTHECNVSGNKDRQVIICKQEDRLRVISVQKDDYKTSPWAFSATVIYFKHLNLLGADTFGFFQVYFNTILTHMSYVLWRVIIVAGNTPAPNVLWSSTQHVAHFKKLWEYAGFKPVTTFCVYNWTEHGEWLQGEAVFKRCASFPHKDTKDSESDQGGGVKASSFFLEKLQTVLSLEQLSNTKPTSTTDSNQVFKDVVLSSCLVAWHQTHAMFYLKNIRG